MSLLCFRCVIRRRVKFEMNKDVAQQFYHSSQLFLSNVSFIEASNHRYNFD